MASALTDKRLEGWNGLCVLRRGEIHAKGLAETLTLTLKEGALTSMGTRTAGVRSRLASPLRSYAGAEG